MSNVALGSGTGAPVRVEISYLPASLTVLAEILDTTGTARSFQAGVRLPFGANSIDLVIGRGLGEQDDHWINMGLNLAF